MQGSPALEVFQEGLKEPREGANSAVGWKSWSTAMGSDAPCQLPGRKGDAREEKPGAAFCSGTFWVGAITGCFQFWGWAPERGNGNNNNPFLGRKAPSPRLVVQVMASSRSQGQQQLSVLGEQSLGIFSFGAVDTKVIQGSCELPRLESRDFCVINV